MNLSRSARKTDMANYTLIARINAGSGKFPFVNVQFSKTHRPIPMEGATYYLRPTTRGKRTPIRVGKDVAVAHTAMVNMDYDRRLERATVLEAHPPSTVAGTLPRKTVEETASEYIQRSKQKSRRTYLGYRPAVNLSAPSSAEVRKSWLRQEKRIACEAPNPGS
jgi:hypothetical protein